MSAESNPADAEQHDQPGTPGSTSEGYDGLIGLPGLDPAWSRFVDVADGSTGGTVRQHLLDTGPALERLGVVPVGTILAVHGNPTWSYLWRSVLAQSLERAAAGNAAWRVIAVDQLEMGWSARTGVVRGLADRIRDLGALTDALGLAGPVVALGHDWGGVVVSGWALAHPQLLHGLVLTNTGVDVESGLPFALRAALAAAATGTQHTTAFLDTTLGIAHPRLERSIRAAYRAPYRTAASRAGIRDFVADIPSTTDHRSRAAIDAVADRLTRLDVPVLLGWGPRDPVFQERYLHDLLRRMPQAAVHRFEGAGHLVVEDADVAGAVLDWVAAPSPARSAAAQSPDAPATAPFRPMWAELEARRDDDSTALVELGEHPRTVTWRLLSRRVREVAAGFTAAGMRPGDRVTLLVPPGADLTAALYACLRIGAIVVVADAGLGVRGLTRAVRGARPSWVIGIPIALAVARTLRWPGIRIAATDLPAAALSALGVTYTLPGLARLGRGVALPPEPGPNDLAAVLFTSGSTGPAKGVRYTHARLAGVRDALLTQYDIGRETGVVAGFAPFALLGPSFGARTSVPDMDVTRPATLTAEKLEAAVAAIDADVVFLSPAALTNVVKTAEGRAAGFDGVRVLLTVGAPVGAPALARAAAILRRASLRTPYGMTECLLVADVTREQIDAAGAGSGVLVGSPVAGARIRIAPLDTAGRPGDAVTTEAGVTGEIQVNAPHMLAGYDRLWRTDRAARTGTPDEPWHRTGDVGHLDADGRLWVEGRLPHVIVGAAGVVTPVRIELAAERGGVSRAAAVGVGPRGTQQLVVIAEGHPLGAIVGPLAEAVRREVDVPVAAVLGVPTLPTDIRHNAKIDRARLARWATGVLAGERVTEP